MQKVTGNGALQYLKNERQWDASLHWRRNAASVAVPGTRRPYFYIKSSCMCLLWMKESGCTRRGFIIPAAAVPHCRGKWKKLPFVSLCCRNRLPLKVKGVGLFCTRPWWNVSYFSMPNLETSLVVLVHTLAIYNLITKIKVFFSWPWNSSPMGIS